MKLSSSTIAALLFLSTPGAAFAPSPSQVQRKATTRLYSDERSVREELKEKTTLVDAKDELEYASTEGEEQQVALPISKLPSDFHSKIERATKTRAYPLFLAEKGAIILEDVFSSLSKNDGETSRTTGDYNAVKERIVILGTGWGAAAFLKDIDTNKFDVTVISPRNHFLFTPMLAGASVGTVEYRSITESIRQVCAFVLLHV